MNGNGITGYEVREGKIFLEFHDPLAPDQLRAKNILIEGATTVGVSDVTAGEDPKILVVDVDAPDDHSLYRLRVLRDRNHPDDGPPEGFDPDFSTVDLTFTAGELTSTTFVCCPSEERRTAILASDINGIDFLEVDDDPTAPFEDRQRRIFVHFIKPLAPGQLGAQNVLIEGGTRIRNIVIENVASGADTSLPGVGANVLLIEVESPGDFSFYRLRILDDRAHPEGAQPDGFDPVLSSIEFSFKAGCEAKFDCQPRDLCPPVVPVRPEINYLAKDYASFRQLMLDRMAVLAPSWSERNPADAGVTLIELLAYVGDYLSYRQDAIATEAYLGTARRRSSIRRHARLVDYFMHDGANARVWIRLEVENAVAIKRGTDQTRVPQFLGGPGQPPRSIASSRDDAGYDDAIQDATVFEMLSESLNLDPAHNAMQFYTWGDPKCCLPKGGTRADLSGAFPGLTPGMVLVLAEVRGPSTGQESDADPAHRHAVRLTSVTHLSDPIGDAFASLPDPAPVTRIEWDAADALPFPLCVGLTADKKPVSEAWGNIILADHGRTVAETLPEVPPPSFALAAVAPTPAMCDEEKRTPKPARYTPLLGYFPVTFSAPFEPLASASASTSSDATIALPSRCVLRDTILNQDWAPMRDLLADDANDRHFVVETELDANAHLRFHRGDEGTAPAAGTVFQATYRAGNGAAGNVGMETIRYAVIEDGNVRAEILRVSNPLAARGGVDPESLERVRQDAPQAFRTQKRAVTPTDYADTAQKCDASVQRATARFRWTGSWRTVFVTVDRSGGKGIDPEFRRRIEACLEQYRMAGHDVELEEPHFVPLEVVMAVCVKRDYFLANVEQALREVFSNRAFPDGSLGMFHPDRFSFGEPVYLSALYAAAQEVEGVDSVEITTFQRQGVDSSEAIDNGFLKLGPLEIARLDNDPNFRENGLFTLDMRGGR